MREIKFRGKRLFDSEWAYGYLWKDDVTGDAFIKDGRTLGDSRVDPDTVSQFVCRSENDQDIYEGDYLTWHDSDEVYELMWDADDSLYYITADYDTFVLADDIKDMTVVGNRWDSDRNC